jgi:hypothetical protein
MILGEDRLGDLVLTTGHAHAQIDSVGIDDRGPRSVA